MAPAVGHDLAWPYPAEVRDLRQEPPRCRPARGWLVPHRLDALVQFDQAVARPIEAAGLNYINKNAVIYARF